MAEGLLRVLGGDAFQALSAGTVATQVAPEAVAVMRELGIDITHQVSKTWERYLNEPIDLVITVCDRVNDACPIFPNARQRRHWSVEDPARLQGTEVDRLVVFRQARDQLRQRIQTEIIPPGES
jgi:arsenate reductase